MLPMNWGMVDKWLGYWVFCLGVVGFVFKFGSNWSTFDVSTSILAGMVSCPCAKHVRDGVGSDIPVAYVISLSDSFLLSDILFRLVSNADL